MKICVVALGKAGLPLAVQCARKGHDVIGVDIKAAVVDSVNAGIAPFPGEPELPELLAQAVMAGNLRASTDTSAAVATSEVVLVVVPVVVDADGAPDFGAIDAATRDIAISVCPGTLVSYETTLPLGTTRNRFGPMLGSDLYLVHSPERVFTGRIFADLRRYPKLLGGVDEPSAKKGIEFYEAVLDFDPRPDLARPNGVWDLGSAEAAELAKLAETSYRDVNIGLANEFARYAQTTGVNIFTVIEAANSQPFSHIHQPGAAVGGHCIPVYPHFYLSGDPQATIVRVARACNASQPAHIVRLLGALLHNMSGSKVAVMGASYRAGVKEHAYSGVFPIVHELCVAGATPVVHDPLYTDEELVGLGLIPYHVGDPVDAVIVHTDHAEYADLAAEHFPGIRALLDGRYITRPELWPGVQREVFGVG